MTESALSTSATINRQAWISSATWDCAWIIGPSFLTAALVLAFPSFFEDSPSLPLWGWVSLVLLVDVAHVYATLFRTYFHSEAANKNSALLTAIPIACWAIGALLYSFDALIFWRVLAYLAVFHFIRQQFGFAMIYSRTEPEICTRFRWLDALAIYMAAVYPLLYWHTHLPRNFDWFVAGDFVGASALVGTIATYVYAVTIFGYATKELAIFCKARRFNVARNLLLIGTALSWWAGIVYVNSDLAFTFTNVLSHGVPYMALIWLHHGGRRSECDDTASGATQITVNLEPKFAQKQKTGTLATIFGAVAANVLLYVACLWLFAWLEEGLWDGFVWREHAAVFPWFQALPQVNDGHVLAVLVPFLALPQSVHYVLDGFIWRIKDKTNLWSADA